MKNAKYNKAFSLIEISIVIVIIGILIVGITQGSRLVRSAKISSAQSLTRSSPAASIKDIFLWLDSTSENVFINENNNTDMENGDCIETWNGINPQSTNKYFFYNNHATLCPLYAEKGINELPSLYFNTNSGTTDHRFLSKDLEFAKLSKFTIFVVAQPIFNKGVNTDILRSCGGGGTIFTLGANTTGYKAFTVDSTVGNSGTYSNSNNFFPIEFNKAVILTMMQGDQGLGLRVNGGNDAGEHEGFVSSAFNGERCSLFFGGRSVLPAFDGYIGEMIVYNRVLNTSDRHEIEKYLSNKWKIQLR